MADDAKHKSGDFTPERTAEVGKIESGNLANQIKIDPKLLKEVSVPTNAHSGSAGGDQNESIGIDFGNGNVVSRQNKMSEASAVQAGHEAQQDGLPIGLHSKSASTIDSPQLPAGRLEPPPLPVPPNPRPIQYEKLPVPPPTLDLNRDTSTSSPPQPSPIPIHYEKPPLPSPILVKNQRQELRPESTPEHVSGLEPESHSLSDKSIRPDAVVFAATDLANKRTELESAVQQKIANPREREQFLNDMRKFEDDFISRAQRAKWTRRWRWLIPTLR